LTETLLNLDEQLINPSLAYYRPDDFYLSAIKEKIAKIFYLPKTRWDKILFWRTVKFINDLKKIIEENDIDLIHAWGIALIFGENCRPPGGRKVIISVRSTKFEDKIIFWT